MQHVAFGVWLLRLSIMFLRSVHGETRVRACLSYGCVAVCPVSAPSLFIHLLMDTWVLSTFW